MKSTVVKRSIVVAGHKTSVSLEDAFWNGLKEKRRRSARLRGRLAISFSHRRQIDDSAQQRPSASARRVSRYYRTEPSTTVAENALTRC